MRSMALKLTLGPCARHRAARHGTATWTVVRARDIQSALPGDHAMFLAPLVVFVASVSPTVPSEDAKTPYATAFAHADEAVRAGKKDVATRDLVRRALEFDS